jgi:hypothetical protein
LKDDILYESATKYAMIKRISLIMVIVTIGLLLIPLTNVEASTHHFKSHLHGTSGRTHHHARLGFIAGPFFKFHQYENPPYENPPYENPPYENPPYENPPYENPPYENPP